LTTQNLGRPSVVPKTTSVAAYQGATLPSVWGGSSPNGNASGTTLTTANVIVSLSGCGGIAATTTDAANYTRTNIALCALYAAGLIALYVAAKIARPWIAIDELDKDNVSIR
jgi:hypothetical protein